MAIYEYMWINIRDIPDVIIKQYNLLTLANKYGFVLVKICKGMYGIPQAGILAHKCLVQNLHPYVYAPCKRTPGM